MDLKPQDSLLALKYWSHHQEGGGKTVRALAEAIGISPGEVSKGSRRLLAAHMAAERKGQVFAETGALLEWLCYGVRYAYPQEQVGYGRGMATAWNCPLLKSEIVPPSPAWVWALPGGDIDGVLIKPLHDSVPVAARKDKLLYHALALVEAIRGGKPRELAIARQQLSALMKGKE